MKTILAIESSCDDTSIAILQDGVILANITATQSVHEKYGGVIPELASRDHLKNIIPTLHSALTTAQIRLEQLDAIAFTQGPGLIGSLIVGAAFAKSLALSLQKPLITVHHMHAHIMSHWIDAPKPAFPFLCMTISGGHTQLVRVDAPLQFTILGQTIDDAAGEAFDKGAKLLQLPYPGGPLIDRLAAQGDPHKYKFPISNIEGYDFSFSGLKTSLLYLLKKEMAADATFIEREITHLCASYQHAIVEQLFHKFIQAARVQNITHIGIAGGVSANSAIRARLTGLESDGFLAYLPAFQYCTDNAAMIAITAWYKSQQKDFANMSTEPSARLDF